jgi:hypothetical protein
MKKIIIYIFIITNILATACNLTQDIEIELPDYESQTMVECYLVPGQPFAALITKSAAYFDPFPRTADQFLQQTLVDGAEVTITYGNTTVKLTNRIFVNPFTGQIFNYVANAVVPALFNQPFNLEVITDEKSPITATTFIPARVPIDSTVIEFNPRDSLARVLVYWTDNQNEKNFYRRIQAVGRRDSITIDFPLDDTFNDNSKFVVGSGFDFAVGDTVFNAIYHLTPDHFNFLNSVFNAAAGNGNPFAQPSTIQSNVKGDKNPLGIFTGLTFEERMTIIRK